MSYPSTMVSRIVQQEDKFGQLLRADVNETQFTHIPLAPHANDSSQLALK